MSMAPGAVMPANGSGAPSFLGPTPPDRVQMSLEDNCNAIVSILASRPPTPEEMQVLSATFASVQQLLMGHAGMDPAAANAAGATDEQAPGQEQATAPPGANTFGGVSDAQDYGTQPGTVPYDRTENED